MVFHAEGIGGRAATAMTCPPVISAPSGIPASFDRNRSRVRANVAESDCPITRLISQPVGRNVLAIGKVGDGKKRVQYTIFPAASFHCAAVGGDTTGANGGRKPGGGGNNSPLIG